MSYQSAFMDDVYFIRWKGPTTSDVQGVLAQVRDAHRRLHRKLICIAVAGEESRPADDQVRKTFADHTATFFQHCEELHMVIEGHGLGAVIVRSIATHLLMLTRRQWKITIHPSIESAIVVVAGVHKRDTGALLQAARAAGLTPAPWAG